MILIPGHLDEVSSAGSPCSLGGSARGSSLGAPGERVQRGQVSSDTGDVLRKLGCDRPPARPSHSPACPPAAVHLPASRAQKPDPGRGNFQRQVQEPQVPGPALPGRRVQNGGRTRGDFPPRQRTHQPPPPPLAPPGRTEPHAVPRPAACRAAAGATPPARRVMRPRPQASRLAAAAGSARPHWPGGGGRVGAPGLHNRRRVGGEKAPEHLT